MEKQSKYTPLGQLKRGLNKVSIKEDKVGLRAVINGSFDRKRYHNIKAHAKRSILGQVIVSTYPEMSFKDFDHEKYIHTRNAFVEWLDERTTGEIYSISELKNLLTEFRKDLLGRIREKLLEKKELDKLDYERLIRICDHLINLHNLKKPKKETVVKMDFSYIRDLT